VGTRGGFGRELEWSRRRWSEVAGDRPAPGGGGIAWTGTGASEKKEERNERRSGARAELTRPRWAGQAEVGRPGQMGFGLFSLLEFSLALIKNK
jgi:hypothetical protein